MAQPGRAGIPGAPLGVPPPPRAHLCPQPLGGAGLRQGRSAGRWKMAGKMGRAKKQPVSMETRGGPVPLRRAGMGTVPRVPLSPPGWGFCRDTAPILLWGGRAMEARCPHARCPHHLSHTGQGPGASQTGREGRTRPPRCHQVPPARQQHPATSVPQFPPAEPGRRGCHNSQPQGWEGPGAQEILLALGTPAPKKQEMPDLLRTCSGLAPSRRMRPSSGPPVPKQSRAPTLAETRQTHLPRCRRLRVGRG